ncbi:UspA10 [Desulforapulum autotrophicum HRM2]|uniref:UspA10 n=1 Tax=Desulforapulum autotrophicum (strain ATCC 43914 / DSM 3382 / VKM B-1955 / HRM2) TaxID=177437 RepID=C0QIV9_DESAH|nr:universal stress protein [Desulforapulum autotrophicum]ACN13749.1 UspA10 [Desulforapulum autotrophicum HRM2]
MGINKILVAIDGSQNSRRTIDYVAAIIKDCPWFTVKLLYIEQSPDRDFFPDDDAWKQACVKRRQEMHAFLSESQQMLIQKGVAPENVQTDYIESCHSPLGETPRYCSQGNSIALDILNIVKQEGFKTVAIGRRGVSKAEEFMFGSVSNKIIHAGRDFTLWVIQ